MGDKPKPWMNWREPDALDDLDAADRMAVVLGIKEASPRPFHVDGGRFLLTGEEMVTAIAPFGINDPDVRRALKAAIDGITRRLAHGLRKEAGPTEPQRRAALEGLAKHLDGALTCLDDLDDRSRSDLLEGLGAPAPSPGDGSLPWGALGERRYRQLEETLTFAREAAIAAVPKSRQGRKPEEAKTEAALELMKVYRDFTGKEPTSGWNGRDKKPLPFDILCESVFAPICRRNDGAKVVESYSRAAIKRAMKCRI